MSGWGLPAAARTDSRARDSRLLTAVALTPSTSPTSAWLKASTSCSSRAARWRGASRCSAADPGPLRPQPVETDVGGDPLQPGAEWPRAVIRGQPAPRPLEGVLGGVLGVG